MAVTAALVDRRRWRWRCRPRRPWMAAVRRLDRRLGVGEMRLGSHRRPMRVALADDGPGGGTGAAFSRSAGSGCNASTGVH